MLCLGRKLDFEVPFHSRIGQTGIYLKEPYGSREFLSIQLGTRFQSKFELWLSAFLLALD